MSANFVPAEGGSAVSQCAVELLCQWLMDDGVRSALIGAGRDGSQINALMKSVKGTGRDDGLDSYDVLKRTLALMELPGIMRAIAARIDGLTGVGIEDAMEVAQQYRSDFAAELKEMVH